MGNLIPAGLPESASMILGRYLDKQPFKQCPLSGFIGGILERIPLPDGGWVSIQASERHYCYPQALFDSFTQYEAFEVMCTVEVPEWETYYDGSIYSCLPAALIVNYFNSIGGFPAQAIEGECVTIQQDNLLGN